MNPDSSNNFSIQNSSVNQFMVDIVSGSVLVGIEGTIFIGNSLVILAVIMTKRLQTVTNLYVISLAFSDVFVSIFVLPLSIVSQLIKNLPMTALTCKLWLSSDVCLCTSSILNLCCISIDRYMAITQPLKYSTRRSKRLARCMILVVWVLAISVTIPGIFVWTDHVTTISDCVITLHKGYRMFTAFCSFIIPFLIIIFVYIRIFWVAYKRKLLSSPEPSRCYNQYRSDMQSLSNSTTQNCIYGNPEKIDPKNTSMMKIRNFDSSEGSVNTIRDNALQCQIRTILRVPKTMNFLQKFLVETNSMTDTIAIHLICTGHSSMLPPLRKRVRFNENDKKKRERAAFRKEHKTAKTLALVVGCFSICWIPFFCLYLFEPFCECTVNIHIITFVTWLGYANSIFNPFIYAFYNKEYSLAFRRLVCILQK